MTSDLTLFSAHGRSPQTATCKVIIIVTVVVVVVVVVVVIEFFLKSCQTQPNMAHNGRKSEKLK